MISAWVSLLFSGSWSRSQLCCLATFWESQPQRSDQTQTLKISTKLLIEYQRRWCYFHVRDVNKAVLLSHGVIIMNGLIIHHFLFPYGALCSVWVWRGTNLQAAHPNLHRHWIYFECLIQSLSLSVQAAKSYFCNIQVAVSNNRLFKHFLSWLHRLWLSPLWGGQQNEHLLNTFTSICHFYLDFWSSLKAKSIIH